MRFQYQSILKYGDEHSPRLKKWRKFAHQHSTILFVVFATVIISLTLYLCGVFTLPLENDFENFKYPLDIANFSSFVQEIDNKYYVEDEAGDQSLVKALEKIKSIGGWNSSLAPLKQFNNLSYLIDVGADCADRWKASDKQSDRLITVIIIVKSAVNNYARRQAIRNSWYENRVIGIFQFKTIFMVGACDLMNPVPKSVQDTLKSDFTPGHCRKAIAIESNTYDDLVQSSGIDSYYNNTIKAVMTLRWLGAHCPRDFFLSLDDDFVFEVDNFTKFLKRIAIEHSPPLAATSNNSDSITDTQSITPMKQLARRYLYAGYVRNYVRPHRHLMGKWYISHKDYPYNKYPRFVTGGAILMSHKTARHFALASYFTQSFRFDDVYMGIMAQKLNMESLHEENFMCEINEYMETVKKNFTPTTCIGVHDINPDDLTILWADRFPDRARSY